ncbi:MAG: type II toxin-antitoxin system RelE/ParE family toxin [Oscillospiraceae bacterium]|nr:type II toxin-antitoxin system RelE/ParE family toxin [Oscillospiraceae bacterium]
MYTIAFYRNRDGKEPITDYLRELRNKAQTNKDQRIRFKKIIEYFNILSQNGTRAGAQYVKHIVEDIWELRPTNNRIFFFYWKDNTFLMLHHFVKKTQKTPSREIEQAKRNLKDFLERNDHHG